MKILVISDSFKGSMTSKQAGTCLARGIRAQNPGFQTEVLSVADGGEGSLKMLASGKKRYRFPAKDPLGRNVYGYYLGTGHTAYLETAITSGLTLLAKDEYNPLITTTYGLGQNILKAAGKGFKHIIIFAGGSATNDAGLGALNALGFTFFTKSGKEIIPLAQNLKYIYSFCRPPGLLLPEITVATDVTNPLFGKNGATNLYADQKGATPAMRKILESGIRNIASLFPQIPINKIPGSGAAGGLAGGLHLFLGAKIITATSLLFQETGLQKKIDQADIVVTGEGRIDHQTPNGKLISKILELSTKKKFIVVAGQIETPLHSSKILRHYSLSEGDITPEQAMRKAQKLMTKKGKELAKFLENKFVGKRINA